MTLIEKQKIFSTLLIRLIDHAYAVGYEVTLGEAWRPKETAEIYAKKGIGIRNSLHCDRLAIDLNIFKKGNLLKSGSDFKDLGEYWESLSGEGFKTCWGGRFGDGAHFSIGDNGRK